MDLVLSDPERDDLARFLRETTSSEAITRRMRVASWLALSDGLPLSMIGAQQGCIVPFTASVKRRYLGGGALAGTTRADSAL